MKIRTTYDAFWFLYYHPKFACPIRDLLTEDEAKARRGKKRHKLVRMEEKFRDSKENYWVEVVDILHRAVKENLDVHYTKVDKTKTVNDDKRKNKYVECWLEFGQLYYEINNGTLQLQHEHDYRLDCGAATFDEALVKLAKLVKKHYGSYSKKDRADHH